MKNLFREIGRMAMRWSVFWFSAFWAGVLASVVYAAIPFGSLPQVTAGSGLTATMWNDLVTHVNQSVKQTTEVITVNGTNVGIGIPSPGQKFSVAGTVESTSGGFKFPDGSVQSASATSAGKILNVTTYKDCMRKGVAIGSTVTMSQFSVNKLVSNSILLIQGSVSGYGNYSWGMTQGWKYWSSTETIGQWLMYSADAYTKTFPTFAVISWDASTWFQTMTFRYYSANWSATDRPFAVHNPNATDDARLAQTCSVYAVMEIAQ